MERGLGFNSNDAATAVALATPGATLHRDPFGAMFEFVRKIFGSRNRPCRLVMRGIQPSAPGWLPTVPTTRGRALDVIASENVPRQSLDVKRAARPSTAL